MAVYHWQTFSFGKCRCRGWRKFLSLNSTHATFCRPLLKIIVCKFYPHGQLSPLTVVWKCHAMVNPVLMEFKSTHISLSSSSSSHLTSTILPLCAAFAFNSHTTTTQTLVLIIMIEIIIWSHVMCQSRLSMTYTKVKMLRFVLRFNWRKAPLLCSVNCIHIEKQILVKKRKT